MNFPVNSSWYKRVAYWFGRGTDLNLNAFVMACSEFDFCEWFKKYFRDFYGCSPVPFEPCFFYCRRPAGDHHLMGGYGTLRATDRLETMRVQLLQHCMMKRKMLHRRVPSTGTWWYKRIAEGNCCCCC